MKSAFVLAVLAVTADVSGTTAMKYQNHVPERDQVCQSSGSKVGYRGVTNYPALDGGGCVFTRNVRHSCVRERLCH